MLLLPYTLHKKQRLQAGNYKHGYDAKL